VGDERERSLNQAECARPGRSNVRSYERVVSFLAFSNFAACSARDGRTSVSVFNR